MSVPSFVKVCKDDEGTMSSISTETGNTKFNLQRGLVRSRKLVKSLTDNRKRDAIKIDLLTKKINQMNHELYKEKKAANVLIERSQEEAKKIMASAESLIVESDRSTMHYLDTKVNEEKERSQRKRIISERLRYSKRLRSVKESLAQEKREKTDLQKDMKAMKANQSEVEKR